MFQDPKFWVALSFLAFLILVGKPVLRFIANSLDARGNRIRSELAEAARLREEAEALLAAYRAKQQESMQEGEAILTRAREGAARMEREAEAALVDALERRTQATTDKIARAEAQVVKDMQAHVVDMAVAAARILLAERAGQPSGITMAVVDLERKLH